MSPSGDSVVLSKACPNTSSDVFMLKRSISLRMHEADEVQAVLNSVQMKIALKVRCPCEGMLWSYTPANSV